MNSQQEFKKSNLAGLIALISLVATIGAMFCALNMLPESPFLGWMAMTVGFLGMLMFIGLVFEAVHFARNGNSASRDEWEAAHKL